MNNDTIANILHAAQWTPTQRLVALDVLVSAEHRPDSQYLVLDSDSSATAIAQRLGVSARSVSDALHALDAVGVITWRRECRPESAKNRYGDEIPINRASRDRGDFIAWQHASIVSMPVDVVLPDVLPESRNVERARSRSVAERRRVAQMQHELQALLNDRECPSCGAHGTMQASVTATCGECGTVMNADEIDAMLSTPAMPQCSAADDELSATPAPNMKTFPDSVFSYPENFSCSNADALKEESGESSEHENFSHDGISAHELDVLDESREISDAPGAALDVFDGDERNDDAEREKFSHSDDMVPAELTGADAITYLASVGVRSFGRLHVIAGKKAGYGRDFLDSPIDVEQAIAHVERSTNRLVGILPEHGDHDLLDIDAGLGDFMKTFPFARTWCRVQRANAPERAKFIVRIKGDRLRHMVRESLDKLRKIEVMGVRHSGVIAGVHPSGSQYVLVTGEIPELDTQTIGQMLNAFIPGASVARSAPTLANRSSSPSGSAAKRAIQFWLSQSANIAQTLALIERRPHVGKHFSLRDNDSTPSAMLTSDDAVHDYGTGAHYDLFDVYCMLTNTDKRSAIHEAYKQMQASRLPA